MAKITDPIFCDAETIPSQQQVIINHIREGIEVELSAKVASIKAEEDAIRAPKNYKDEAKIAEYIAEKIAAIDEKVSAEIAKATAEFDEAWRRTALDGAFGQVAAVSMAFGEDYPISVYEENWKAPGAEVRLLQRVNETIEAAYGGHRGILLVGHNIAGFDRPFLRQRGIIHGVRMHPVFTRPAKPWDNDVVFDTMTEWTGAPNKGVKLDKLCLALGLQMKGTELDEEDAEFNGGSMVWDYIRDGKIKKVARYCDYDVIRCRGVYYRLKYLQPPAIVEPSCADELEDIPA